MLAIETVVAAYCLCLSRHLVQQIRDSNCHLVHVSAAVVFVVVVDDVRLMMLNEVICSL